MAITKDKKREILAKIEDALKDAKSLAFVGFNKLTVADASALRKELRESGVGYYVAKKTLLKRALTSKGYQGEMPELPGEVALAWTSDDVTAPSRGVHSFGKKLKGALTLLGGVFEGSFVNQSRMIEIATIPSMDVLRGMFANVINSPRQRFAIALSEVAKTKN